MAAESPFGSSFGDPRKYMGQSPLGQIGQALKTGLTAYALKESGLTDYLNKLNSKPGQAPIAPGIQGTTPAMSGGFGPVAPPQADAAATPPQANAIPPVTSGATTFVTPQTNDAPPPDIGDQILDNKWDGYQAPVTGPVSFQNQTDFNPVADGGNQFAAPGSEFQKPKDHSKLKKIVGAIFGQG